MRGKSSGNTAIATPLAHGFLYSAGTYVSFDDPSATNGTAATDINNSGQIVGTYRDGIGTHGFLYSGGTYATIDDPLAATGQTYAAGINDAAR